MKGTIIVQAGPTVRFKTATNFNVATGPKGIAAGHFTSSGNLDLAVASPGNSQVSILIGNGAGSFAAATNIGTGTGTAPVALSIADLTGDGINDIVTVNGGTGSILVGDGNGGFAPELNPATLSGTATVVTTGQLNPTTDSNTDILANNTGAANLLTFFGSGNGDFPNQGTVTLNSAASAIALGDLNGDQRADILVAHSAGNSVGRLLSNGDGTFSTETETTLGASTGPTAIALGDFNSPNDNKLDVAVAETTANKAGVLLGSGTGTLTAQTFVTTGTSPVAIAVADFNGDGKLDIVTADSVPSTLNVSVLMGNGDGTLNPKQDFTAGTTPAGVAVGDFNNDGAPDIAVSNTGTNNVSILLNEGGTLVTVQSSSPNSTVGQSVTFTASVVISVAGSSPPSPTGTVTFFDGVSQIGAPAPLTAGSASVSTLSLGAGARSITARYNGDSVYNPHTSAAITQTVRFQTSVTAPSSSKNPSVIGDTVTFSATVNTTGAGATPATGTLTFKSDGNSIGDGALATTVSPAAAGSVQTSALNLGSRSITADYPGDNTHTASNSGALIQAVNQPGAFSQQTVDFGNSVFGVTTGPRSLTLTNNGGSSLSLVTLATSGDFSQANDCGGILGAGQSCNIDLFFTPITLGTRTGSLTLDQADQANLSGNAVDFEVNLARLVRPARDGGGAVANPRSFAILVSAPAGTPGEVTFSCDGLPVGASCSFSPAKVRLDSGAAVRVTVNMPRRSKRIAAHGSGATFHLNAHVGSRVRTLTMPVPSQ